MQKQFLESLSSGDVLNKPFPLKELVPGSVYYPCSNFDGQLVKHFGKHNQSFIYCDYGTNLAQLDEVLTAQSFYGYKLLAQRNLKVEELIPKGWQPVLPPIMDKERYMEMAGEGRQNAGARWMVFERQEGFNDEHGPTRFSLVYIIGEAIATYQALYWSNNCSPDMLALIQPGLSFSNNWARDIVDANGPMHWVSTTKGQVVHKIVYGGYDNTDEYYKNLAWPGYVLAKSDSKIQPYYSNGRGCVLIYVLPHIVY